MDTGTPWTHPPEGDQPSLSERRLIKRLTAKNKRQAEWIAEARDLLGELSLYQDDYGDDYVQLRSLSELQFFLRVGALLKEGGQ